MDNLLNINELSQNSKTEDLEEMILDKHFIKKEKVVQILCTPPDERTEDQNEIIKSYILDISNIPKKFSLDNIEEKDYKEIIAHSVKTCQYKIIKHLGELIYNINEESDFFYIILKGNVKIFDLKKFSKEMNGHSYYDILLNYRNKKENYLLKKTIDENFHNYPVEYNDMKIIDKIMIKLNLMKLETDNDPNIDPDYLEYLLKYYGSSLTEFRLETYRDVLKKKNEKTIRYNKILIEQKKEDKVKPLLEYNIYDARLHSNKNRKILQNQLNYISPEICRKYYFFMNENNENISYYELIEDKLRTNNEYFGDLENNRYTQRALGYSENLELLKFSNEIYKDFIKRERAKIIDSQANFFLNNFFFEKITKEHFIRYYFPLFESINFILNQIIISENEKVEYIYFIKSGIVKLISNRSILENYIIIDLIKNVTTKNEASESEENENKKNIKDYVFKTDTQLLKKELNIKHKSHLITYQKNQALGYECFYFGINYLYTAIAESKEVKLYRIKIKHLIEILKEKGQIGYKHLIKKAENTMKLLLERFTLINNDLMKFYDRKFLDKKNLNQIKSKKNKERKEIRKLKNKFENFGILLSDQDENKKENNFNSKNNINDSSEMDRKNYIKKLFKEKLLKNKKFNNKNIEEDSKFKSHELFKVNKRRVSYKDFFEEKTFYPKINENNKLKQNNISPEKLGYNIISNSTGSFNLNTNYTNAKKEIRNKKRNENYYLKKNKSQKPLLLSNNYFFSDNSSNNSNNLLERTLFLNKKLLSNIFSSVSTYKKISNDEIKKKITPQKRNYKYSTLKHFDKLIEKKFSLNRYDISYKYDFRRDLVNNIKLLKYSIFDDIKTPRIEDKKISLKLEIFNKSEKKTNL